MKLSSSLTIIFHLLLLQQTLFSAMADKQFIINTCNNNVYPHLCLQILRSNPKSESADLTGLALIGVSAVNHKALEVLQQVHELKKSRPELTPSLVKCSEVYHAVVHADVPSSKEALQGGMAKYAEDGMADAAVESQVCESSFGEHGQTSPMTGSNKFMNDVANVARGIIRMLL